MSAFGEVHICRFPFTSGEMTKVRPSLVLFDLQQDVIICRITSVMRTGLLDVALNDWREAGLLRPSIVRLDRIVTAERSILSRCLGLLALRDAQTVRERWNVSGR